MAASSSVKPTVTATNSSATVKAAARRPSGFVGVNSIFGYKGGHAAVARSAAGNTGQADRSLAQRIGVGFADWGGGNRDRPRIARAFGRAVRAEKPSREIGRKVTAAADPRPVINTQRFQLFQQDLVGAQVFLR